jgi:RHS repeat-associated protein
VTCGNRLHSFGLSCKRPRVHAFSTAVLKFVRNCQTATVLPLMAIRNAISPLRITYPGTATSQFTYDAFGHIVKIVESTGSTKQFIWCGDAMCEARDGSGSLLNQYFPYGQTISGSNYFYTIDHLGSVREMTDSSGNIQAQYSYDSYGRVAQLQGSLAADFQYAGYYFHAPSGLNLAVHRAYSSGLGRWTSRDPLAENEGTNLFCYVDNEPVNDIDPLGLRKKHRRKQPPPPPPPPPAPPPDKRPEQPPTQPCTQGSDPGTIFGRMGM